MILRNLSGLKIAVALCCVLALTACSKKNTPNLEAANAGLGAGASSPPPMPSISPAPSTNGQQQSSINRLTVRVHVTINKRKEGKVDEYDVSRSFDFSARQSLQTAEASLLDEMIRNLTDEIFNKLFSDW
jgi:hypothetical protein